MLKREEILSEVQKIQYLYGLKHEMRYDGERTEEIQTESVAEHIYGMYVLAAYFLPLEDPDRAWDRERIQSMITWHDIDEIETGDIIGYLKTKADRDREKEASRIVIANVPETLKPHIHDLLTEYEAQKTREACFVKAIDKIEPLFHVFNENGKQILLKNKTTYDDHARIKDPYVKDFPYLKLFTRVIGQEMQAQGFFTEVASV